MNRSAGIHEMVTAFLGTFSFLALAVGTLHVSIVGSRLWQKLGNTVRSSC